MTDYYRSIKTYPVDFKVPLSDSNRGHRIFQLANGILTLLISDPRNEIGSASICIATGSHNDPEYIPGLAHLCEHALFMGTKEFPKPNLYHETVQAYGGLTNAFTTGEQTCFQFEVPVINGNIGNTNPTTNKEEGDDESIFDHVLRNFASFFKSPLFRENEIRNEISSVNDENICNRNSPEKIFFHALKFLSNKGHPFSRFATGNLQTLENIPKSLKLNIYSELFKFYQSHYLPEKMTLVISGPQSLNHLQRLALMNFSSIGKKSIKSKKYFETEMLKHHLSEFSILSESWGNVYREPIFKQCNISKCLFVKSDVHSRLRIIFPMKPTKSQKEYKLYQHAWMNILGDESIGSLCAYLIELEDLAFSVNLFRQSLTFQDDVLILDITLTRKGQNNILKILVSIFQYINQIILNCSYNIMGHYLSDMATIETLNFIYREPSNSPMEEAAALAEILQKDISVINPLNILKGYNDWMDEDLDYSGDYKVDPGWWRLMAAKFIAATMKTLNTANCNILILDSNPLIVNTIRCYSANSIVLNTKDQYNDFEYTVCDIDNLFINKKSLEYCCYFSFPEPNIYLAYNQKDLNSIVENISLKAANISWGFLAYRISERGPTLIDSSQFHEVWHKFEEYTSKITASCRLQGLSLEPSPSVTIGIEILVELIGNKLRHELFPGELVGYSWGLFPGLNCSSSITLTATGLKDKFGMFLFFIVEKIQEITSNFRNMPYNQFTKAQASVRRQYEDFLKSGGVDKAMAGSIFLLEEGIWSLKQRLDALDEINMDLLEVISLKLFGALQHLNMFIQGDIKIHDAFKISRILQSLGRYEKKTNTNNFQETNLSSYLMKQGKSYIYEDNDTNNGATNTIFYYIQIGIREDVFNRTISKFAAHILSIFAATELRAKRKLGYLVSSGSKLFRTTTGIYITISSGNHSPHYLNSQIEDFLYELELILFEYSEEKFQNFKKTFAESYLKHNTQKDQSFHSGELYGVNPVKSSSVFPKGKMYYMHRNYFDKIVNKTYTFGGLNGEYEIDLLIIDELTKDKFFEFFKSRISIKSRKKSSLSLLLFSQEKVKSKCLKTQILEFLTEEGISVSNNNLKDIICKYDNNNLSLSKSGANMNHKIKNERTKLIMYTLKKIYRAKIESFTSSNVNKYRKMKRNNIVKNLGGNYISNEPYLVPTILTDCKQLHDESTLKKNVCN